MKETVKEPHSVANIFSHYTRKDVIELFDGHGKHKEVDSLREVPFTNSDFTLYNLSMIASVVHELHVKYPLQAVQGSWFVATIVAVAMSLYGQVPGNLDQFWGTDVKHSVDAALPLFQQMKSCNEQMVIPFPLCQVYRY